MVFQVPSFVFLENCRTYQPCTRVGSNAEISILELPSGNKSVSGIREGGSVTAGIPSGCSRATGSTDNVHLAFIRIGMRARRASPGIAMDMQYRCRPLTSPLAVPEAEKLSPIHDRL
jgi:hypothetical protein